MQSQPPTPRGDCRARGSLRASALLALLAASSAAQYLPVAGLESVDYSGPSVSGHALQRLAVFHPNCTPPPDGFPVVVSVSNSGLASTTLFDDVHTGHGPLYHLLDAGFALVSVSATYSDFGAPYKGKGLFHPPGHRPPVWVGPPPYADPTRPMAEKDMVMAMQHLRHHASSLGLDPERIVQHGRSGGAIVAMWTALGPERGAMTFLGGSGQELQSTRPAAAILQSGCFYFPAWKQNSPNLPSGHLPHASGAPLWLLPAGTLAQSLSNWQVQASALVYQDAALNAALPVYLTYGEGSPSSDFTPATPGGTDYVEDVLSGPHSAWHGFVWKTLYPEAARLVLTDTEPLQASTSLHDALIEDEAARSLDMIAWLEDALVLQSAWEDAGHPLVAPAQEQPLLLGCGPLQAGSLNQVGASGLPASSEVLLVVGWERVAWPFAGGVLVPSPDLVLALDTDEAGVAQLPFVLPAASPPVEMWMQVWALDPDAPHGLVATNALSGRVE